jgi:ElaA protein
MDWKCCYFDQLEPRDLYMLMRARSAIFVVEQSYVHLDLDGRDQTALHVFATEWSLAPMPIVAYARVLPGDEHDPEVQIDKLFTSPYRRGDGTAEQLLQRVREAIVEHWPGAPMRVNVPSYLKSFYESVGFKKADGPYLDRGQPHIGMVAKGGVSAVAKPRGASPMPGYGRRVIQLFGSQATDKMDRV